MPLIFNGTSPTAINFVHNGTTTSLTKVQVVKNNTTTVVWEKTGWATTWTGSESAAMKVRTGTTGIGDGTNTWYTGTATKIFTVAGGYIKNTTSKTRITVEIDGTEKTFILTSSRQLIGSGSSSLVGNVKTSVYASLTSDGIVFITESKSTRSNSIATSAVTCVITKIEQYS